MDQGSVDDREEARLGALRDLNLLDSAASESFDRITRMASRLFGAPVSAISLTDRDRQFFKSQVGAGGREFPRLEAPCAEVTRAAATLVIPDLLRDLRYADGLLARSGIRFYAGAPLVTRDGHALGAICVLDKDPRTASDEEMAALRDFAAMVMAQVELEHDFGRVDPLSGLPNRHQLADDLREPDFAPRLARALERRALPPAAVELELTESALVGDGGRPLEQLGLLRAMGVEVAIDDFGTGYSAFSYLRAVPASTVKLDRSFVRPLPSDRKARRLVASMIEMAHGLGFRVVAEGVETTAELDFLVERGCEEAQGFLFCRPVDPEALEEWLATRTGQGHPR